MPPWSYLTEEQRRPWLNEVRVAVKGEHPLFEFHEPDTPPREEDPVDVVELVEPTRKERRRSGQEGT